MLGASTYADLGAFNTLYVAQNPRLGADILIAIADNMANGNSLRRRPELEEAIVGLAIVRGLSTTDVDQMFDRPMPEVIKQGMSLFSKEEREAIAIARSQVQFVN